MKTTRPRIRLLVFILNPLIPSLAVAQIKDTRAVLNVEGRVNEISVSPKGRIWLVSAVSKTYYADGVRAGWHYGPDLSDTNKTPPIGNDFLERINFFNSDTAIMTGYISASADDGKKDGLYWTGNAGKTWEPIHFDGNDWIYDAFTDAPGHAWMGGSSGTLFHSCDYGRTWTKLNSPYNSSSRMHCVFMKNAHEGVSGALGNLIYLTRDNWVTSRKIPTPVDQKKIFQGSNPDHRINKIILWNGQLVVNQNGLVFYSDTARIDWKPFSPNLIDFTPDNTSGDLFAITADLRAIKLSSPSSFESLGNQRLGHMPQDIKSTGGALYIIDGADIVYRAGKGGIEHDGLYTTDRKISAPAIIRQSGSLTWGTDDKELYLSTNGGKDWYREATLGFRVADFRLSGDSVAILWDGNRDNYSYSLQRHAPVLYKPQSPLTGFLASPVRYFSISSGSQGCFHYFEDFVSYQRTDEPAFRMSGLNKDGQKRKTRKMSENLNPKRLDSILSAIDKNPSAMPSLKDFRIQDTDVRNYRVLLKERLSGKESGFSTDHGMVNIAFLEHVPASLDTISDASVTRILEQGEGGWSTTSNWVSIRFVNGNSDTLFVDRTYSIRDSPWKLPWEFAYRGQHFNCYNPAFSMFVRDCMPAGFRERDFFDNRHLIMAIAEYLDKQKMQ